MRYVTYAALHRFFLVEDAAQALGSTYRGLPCGAFGNLDYVCFHESKVVIRVAKGAR